MAKKKKKAMKKSAKKAAKKSAKKGAKKAAKKAAAKRSSAKRRTSAASPPKMRAGTITHTELASADPVATKSWCERVLGWKFGAPMPTPTGPYHMWRFDIGTGGGLRSNNPPEAPGSVPYCEVASIRDTFEKALAAGASEMMAPQQLPDGMGWIALVAAPGGVMIGFWSVK